MAAGQQSLLTATSGTVLVMPTYQAQGTITGGTGALTRAWPAHLVGDVALLAIQTIGEEAATLTTASGFTLLDHCETGSGTTGMASGSRLTVFWCRATSTSMADVVIADAGDHILPGIFTFRGCRASGDPWNVYALDTKPVESTSLTYPPVTTTVVNCLIVNIGTRGLPDSGASWSSLEANASLSDFTVRADAGSAVGIGCGLTLFTGGLAAIGSSGSTTSTVTSSINAMMTIALRG